MNGKTTEQVLPRLTIDEQPCDNCGAIAIVAVMNFVFNPSSALLQASPLNPNLATTQARLRDGYALCHRCLRREIWTLNAQDPQRWDREVIYAGLKQSPVAGEEG